MDEKFRQTEELYNSTDVIDVSSSDDKKKIFQVIAMIMLAYNITNNVMKLSKNDRIDLFAKTKNLITGLFAVNLKTQNANMIDLLIKVSNGKNSIYGSFLSDSELQKIINSKYKGEYWYERLIKNKTDTAKKLISVTNDFLKGKISVNDIKGRIEKIIKFDSYATKRLFETENARVQSEIAERYFKANKVKKVRYVALLDENTCPSCFDLDGEIYDINDPARIQLPQHSKCRCYYVEVDS